MAQRQWGPLCPEDGSLLLERPEWHARGVAWCPNSIHGGNGRFWREQEVKEGWYDPTRPPEPTEALAEIKAKRDAEIAAHMADRERYNKERQEKERRRMTEAKTPKPKAGKEPRACLCGCGEMTKGGRFIPGHDARFHARIKTLEAQGVSHDEAEKIASQGPLPAKYTEAAKAAKAAKATPASEPTDAPVTAVPKPASKGRSKKATRAVEPEAEIEV